MLVAGFPQVSAQRLSRLGFVQIGASSEVERLCVDLLTQDPISLLDDELRLSSALRLAQLKDPDAIGCLLGAALQDPEKTIRAAAVGALRYAKGNDAIVTMFLVRLHPVIGEPEPLVRKTIVRTLQSIITVDNTYATRLQAAKNLIDTALQDPNEEVRDVADGVVRSLGAEGVLPIEDLVPDENGDENDKKNGNESKSKPPSGLSTAAKVGIGLGVFGLLGGILAFAAMKD